MESFSLDIEPQQVVRWLQEEQRAGRLPVQVRATRDYAAQAIDPPIEDIGGDATDPLGEVTAIGVLEVRPLVPAEGWLLLVRVEDDAGARLPEDEPVPDGEEEIDLETFNAEFIAPERGTASVSLEVENDTSTSRFEPLLRSMLQNLHANKEPSKPRSMTR
jgi:hypothetical protein